MCSLMARSRGARSVERSAIWAFVPVVAMAPFSLLALGLLWWPVNMVFGVPFRWTVVVFAASGLLLFVRPFQTAVLTPILGARPAQPEEAALIAPAWAEIAQANNLPPNRYALRVLPSDELNAFACGGHLVVVTSFAAQELTPAQLRGVLAHEISHHLGLHTVAITIAHWLSAPVVFLAQIGFFFENVSQAAAQSFGRHSPVIEVVGQFAATFFKAVSWVFTAALRAGDALGNFVGRRAEFEADKRAVAMGFGPELASALRQVLANGTGGRTVGWRARLTASHPAARTRVARIEALQRHPAR
jgi:Zn-dependent protease with chaperone function